MSLPVVVFPDVQIVVVDYLTDALADRVEHYVFGVKVGTGNENGLFRTCKDHAADIGIVLDRTHVRVEFHKSRLVEDVGGGLGAIECYDADAFVTNLPTNQSRRRFSHRLGIYAAGRGHRNSRVLLGRG